MATSEFAVELIALPVSPIRRKTPVGAWDGGSAPGRDPARGDCARLGGFADPDGSTWILQVRGFRQTPEQG